MWKWVVESHPFWWLSLWVLLCSMEMRSHFCLISTEHGVYHWYLGIIYTYPLVVFIIRSQEARHIQMPKGTGIWEYLCGVHCNILAFNRIRSILSSSLCLSWLFFSISYLSFRVITLSVAIQVLFCVWKSSQKPFLISWLSDHRSL